MLKQLINTRCCAMERLLIWFFLDLVKQTNDILCCNTFSFHKIELLAVRKNFTLRVNDGTARSIVNEGKNDFLNVRR